MDNAEAIIEFAKKEAMLPKSIVINLDSRLFEELELTGDDALEFIVAYSKRFNVNISNFMADKYFAGEGMNWFVGNENKKSLTLRDLLKGIQHGRLDETVLKCS